MFNQSWPPGRSPRPAGGIANYGESEAVSDSGQSCEPLSMHLRGELLSATTLDEASLVDLSSSLLRNLRTRFSAESIRRRTRLLRLLDLPV